MMGRNNFMHLLWICKIFNQSSSNLFMFRKSRRRIRLKNEPHTQNRFGWEEKTKSMSNSSCINIQILGLVAANAKSIYIFWAVQHSTFYYFLNERIASAMTHDVVNTLVRTWFLHGNRIERRWLVPLKWDWITTGDARDSITDRVDLNLQWIYTGDFGDSA